MPIMSSSLVLASWTSQAGTGSALIIPDGCRDIILRERAGQPPELFVSVLDNTARMAQLATGDRFRGLRLRPGVSVDETALLTLWRNSQDFGAVARNAGEFMHLEPDVAEALDAIGADRTAPSELGVSARTLQRLLERTTGRSPGYWRQLARVRRAGRAASRGARLSEVAAEHGYADQAHMTRDMRRWLGVSPSRLKCGSIVAELLCEPGYF
jgi:AraC-like DNA-binding protein